MTVKVKRMKVIRGARAVAYARENGILFNIDQDFLAGAEAETRGVSASMVDVSLFLEEKVGRRFSHAEGTGGGESFDFLVNRYGDGWIYVPVEGNDPEAEERITLRMFRRLLEERGPVSGSDVKELLGRYGRPRFGDMGFPRDAGLNLLYHAALRLVTNGLLESVEDSDPPPARTAGSYGRRRFVVPADFKISLAGVLCENCRQAVNAGTLSLHRECAKGLKRALADEAARVRGRRGRTRIES